MVFKKLDCTIQIQSSSCCCPPGIRRKGMHTNATTIWYKIDNNDWIQHHSFSKLRKCAMDAKNCAEFLKLINV